MGMFDFIGNAVNTIGEKVKQGAQWLGQKPWVSRHDPSGPVESGAAEGGSCALKLWHDLQPI